MKKIVLAVGLLVATLYGKEYIGVVTKVVDGDTINIKTNSELLKVRILFIDTPEKYGGAKLEKDSQNSGISTKDEQVLGKLSSAYANNFFKIGDKVQVVSDQKDRYGRILGIVNKNNINYSYQIIKDGYSCIYRKASYPRELDNLLFHAKQIRAGLWNKDFRGMEALCYSK